jgi:hypothetical protein
MNWLTRKRILSIYTAKYRKMIRTVFSAQLKEVLDKVNADFINSYQKIISQIDNEKLSQAYIKLYKEVGMRFADIKIKVDAEVIEGMILNLADIGTRISLVNGYTKEILEKAVKQAVSDGLEQGMSIDQIVDQIRLQLKTDFNGFATGRAFRIAVTEVGMASNAGASVGLKNAVQMGIDAKKVWLTAPWGVAKTERHNLIAGLGEQRPRIDESFNVGGVMMRFPGDPSGGVENVVNCRCALSWEVQ